MLTPMRFQLFYLAPMAVLLLAQIALALYSSVGLAGMSSFGLWLPLYHTYSFASDPASLGGRLVLPVERDYLTPYFVFLGLNGLAFAWYCRGVARRFSRWSVRMWCLSVLITPWAVVGINWLNYSCEKGPASECGEAADEC